ncbi:hypothetical protein GUJ93_ZPchr0012g20010 [Zizania palustris]|uniref:Uncharacterized protein n=1 Tax=Zizania palustris TaxID=103762 RepID=A0A8J5WN92_ZIZPA|nr:hypothetical protein GUJ93_ZPchr0012g20010 [Zizania palustris]
MGVAALAGVAASALEVAAEGRAAGGEWARNGPRRAGLLGRGGEDGALRAVAGREARGPHRLIAVFVCPHITSPMASESCVDWSPMLSP